MAVLRVAPHRLLRFVPEVDQGRPAEHRVRDLRTIFGHEYPPERGDDLLLGPPEDLDGAVEAAHVELREAEGLPNRTPHHEIVAVEDAEVVPGLVRDHHLGQLREVRALGLERADDLVEAEAFEERLGSDEGAYGNRKLSLRLIWNVLKRVCLVIYKSAFQDIFSSFRPDLLHVSELDHSVKVRLKC